MAEEKKDKTGLITAVIAGVVALSTGVMTNYDKIFGKTATSPQTEVSKVNDTLSFSYKLDKVAKDCPNDFSNIIGNVSEEDKSSKTYYSKINFDEGISSISFEDKQNPTFMIILYTGTDYNEANKKKMDIYKKISEIYKVKPTTDEEKGTDGSVTQETTFEKGNTQVGIIETNNSDGSMTLVTAVAKK